MLTVLIPPTTSKFIASSPQSELIMIVKTSLLALASTLLAGSASAGPLNTGAAVDEKRQLSLPPLIPAIPGVTEPLNGVVPPLPIVQVPLPPKESPPFTGANIRPKKIGYFWTGPGDKGFKDFLVTLSLDDVRLPPQVQGNSSLTPP